MHLAVPLALLAAASCGPGTPAAPPPQRVLLVSIDTLRADHLGCYGASDAHTPHLDTLAARGVRFEVALSPAPLTLPAHASLMTGLEPPAHGVRHNSIHRLGPGFPTLAEGMREAGFATAAFVGALVLDRRFGLDRGFDVYDDHTSGRVSAVTGYAERTADEVVDAALAWLERAPDRFFLWVHFYDPHSAYRPPPGFAAAFASNPYAGEIAFVDAQLGRLLDALEQRWGWEEMALVVTSDHGESLGEHGEITHSYGIYEATQRIPLLLAGPGLPAGRVAPGPAALVDVAPTLLAWVGAPPLPGAQGRDLRQLQARDELDERSVYMETLATHLDFGWSGLAGVRSGRFKYVRAPRPELYDLELDPAELDDRSVAEPERVAALDRLLARHLSAPAGTAETVELDASERERLRSLGYLVPDAEGAARALDDPAAWSAGPDPKDALRAGGGILAQLVHAQGDLHEGRADAALERLRALGSDATSVLALRGAAALAAGDAAAAESDAREVLRREPARADMRVLLARALAESGRSEAADAALAQLPPDVAPAPWVVLRAARGELAAGRRDAAERRLALARKRHPDAPELASLHGALLEERGRLEEALAAREAALALSPGSASARNDVAWTLALLARDLERARELAQQALELAGPSPEVLDTLATVQWAAGDATAARATLDRALPGAEGATREHLLELRAALEAGAASEDAPPRP